MKASYKQGRYQTKYIVGAGGMAEVYRAIDLVTQKDVAIKRMLEKKANDKDERSRNANYSRFKREIQLMSNLNHVNIVKMYDVFEEDGFDFIVMEYVPGRDLKNLLNEKNFLSFREALDIFWQVCLAVKAVHAQKIAHRDIKPQNILVKNDGVVKLVDFGISWFEDAEKLTKTGNAIGTAAYMAPERFDAETTDLRSDIWAVGIIVWELLVGVPPYAGSDSLAIYKSLLEKPIPRLKQLSPAVPSQIDTIVAKCLQRDVKNRYQTIDEVLYDLDVLHKAIQDNQIDEQFLNSRLQYNKKDLARNFGSERLIKNITNKKEANLPTFLKRKNMVLITSIIVTVIVILVVLAVLYFLVFE